MNKKIFQILFFLIVVIAFAIVIKNFVDSITSDINEYSHVIQKQPKNEISRLAPIIINLAQDIDDLKFPINEPIDADIISFTPKIKGYTYFTDKRTIEFQPNEPLPEGFSFKGVLHINKIFSLEDLPPFRFKFSTPMLTYKVSLGEVHYFDSVGNASPNLKGYIAFNDYVDFNKIPNLINAYQNNNKLHIDFIPGQNYQSVKFIINGIERDKTDGKVIVKWKAESINSEFIDSTVVKIVSIDTFKIINYSLSYFPKPILKISFSNLINKQILLDSIVKVTQLDDYQVFILNNELRIYFNKISNKTHNLSILKHLQSKNGIELKDDFNFSFQLVNAQPLVCLSDSSHFKPVSKKNNFIDIKVLNLKKVSVEITHIPDNNMIQFLQVNNINGNKEIKRVGKSIYNKTFDLQTFVNYLPNQLTTYNLNLLGADLSKSGLYNFKFSYSNNSVVYSDSIKLEDDFANNDEEPKKVAYNYNSIFSDLYVVAKRTTLDTLYIYVNSRITGKPVKQSHVDIFDFQQNRHASLFTDDNGIVKVEIKERNLFVRIEFNKQITYLKINDLNTISKSNEEIGVIKSNKGVLLYLTGLNPQYNSADSLHVGIVLKKNGRLNLEKKSLEIKLKSPNNTIFNTEVSNVLSSLIKLYKVKLPYNSKSGIWKIVVVYDNVVFQYPFNVINRYNVLTDSILSIQNSKKIPLINSELMTINSDNLLLNDSLGQANTKLAHLNENKIQPVSFYYNKSAYEIGDTCKIYLSSDNLIPTSGFNTPMLESIEKRFSHFISRGLAPGLFINGLLTIENSTNVFHSRWLSCKKNSKQISLIISEDMLPGFYLSFLPSNKSKSNAISKYIPVVYSNDNSWLGMELDAPYDISASSKIPLLISNTNNNTLNYFINLSYNDTLQNSRMSVNNFFNKKQQNCISTWNSSYFNSKVLNDSVLNYNFSQSQTSILNISKKQLLFGPFTIEGVNSFTHYVNIPDKQGIINIRIIGVEESSGRVFEINKTAEVSENISLLTNLPAYVYGGDIVELQIELHNNNLVADSLLIEVKDLVNFDILSSPHKEVVIDRDSSVFFTIRVKAKSTVGNGQFIISSTSNKSSAQREIVIPIQSNPIFINKSVSKMLPPQLAWQQTIKPIGTKGTNIANLEISESNIPSILQILKTLDKNSSNNLSYLINKNFPLIYLNNVIDNDELIEQFTKSINDILVLVKQYQTPSGSFVDKLGDKKVDVWLTSYVGEFMLEAKQYGYEINEGVLNKWHRYQQREIYKKGFALNKGCNKMAYQVFTLSKSGFLKPENLDDYSCYLSNELLEKLYLASAYIEIGNKKQAILLVNIDSVKFKISTLSISESALLLNVTNNFHLNNLSLQLVNHINELIKNKTNTPTEIVLALNSILKDIYISESDKNIKLDYQINHGKNMNLSGNSFITYLDLPLEFTLQKHIDITNNGSDTIYLNLSNYGSPQGVTKNYIKADKITISNKYLNIDNTPIDMQNIQLGSFYKQIIKYKNRDVNRMQELSVSIPIPSGVDLVYSNVPILFDAKNNEVHGLLKTELIIEPTESKEVILIFKAVFKGSYTSYFIKTYNINRFYFENYTPQLKLKIK